MIFKSYPSTRSHQHSHITYSAIAPHMEAGEGHSDLPFTLGFARVGVRSEGCHALPIAQISAHVRFHLPGSCRWTAKGHTQVQPVHLHQMACVKGVTGKCVGAWVGRISRVSRRERGVREYLAGRHIMMLLSASCRFPAHLAFIWPGLCSPIEPLLGVTPHI